MKSKIKQTILSILEEKRSNGDVLPFATSIEVAHRLNMGAWEIEQLSKDIEGINNGRTLNHEWYYDKSMDGFRDKHTRANVPHRRPIGHFKKT